MSEKQGKMPPLAQPEVEENHVEQEPEAASAPPALPVYPNPPPPYDPPPYSEPEQPAKGALPPTHPEHQNQGQSGREVAIIGKYLGSLIQNQTLNVNILQEINSNRETEGGGEPVINLFTGPALLK